MDHFVAEVAKRHFRDREPLGPVVAPQSMSRQFFEMLFETENRLIIELNKEAQLFIGRRGSGKTSFLNSIQFLDERSLVVEITSENAFSKIVNAIEGARQKNEIVYVEQISRISSSRIDSPQYSSVPTLLIRLWTAPSGL